MNTASPNSIECAYCADWNREHPDQARTECGPCEHCEAPGHIGAHPRQPTSLCLCRKHWDELASPGFHFELHHLIYWVILVIVATLLYTSITRHG